MSFAKNHGASPSPGLARVHRHMLELGLLTRSLLLNAGYQLLRSLLL
jgi:hypothetical protein